MHYSRIALLLTTGLLLWWPAEPSQAQSPLPIQDRPTLSPWLNLYRRDPGPVGPYLSYVRPEQRLLSRLSQQRMELASQNTAIRSLQGGVSQAGPQTPIAPTGTGATFMNHAAYFNTRGANGSNAGSAKGSTAQAGQGSWSLPAANTSYGSSSGL